MAEKRDTILISLTLPELAQIEQAVHTKIAAGQLDKPFDFLSFWQMERTDDHAVVMLGLFEAMVCTYILPTGSSALERIRKVRNRLITSGIDLKNAPQRSEIAPIEQADTAEPGQFTNVSLDKHQMQSLCQCINFFDPMAVAYGYMSHWIRNWMRSPDGNVVLPVSRVEVTKTLKSLTDCLPKSNALVQKFSHARTYLEQEFGTISTSA